MKFIVARKVNIKILSVALAVAVVLTGGVLTAPSVYGTAGKAQTAVQSGNAAIVFSGSGVTKGEGFRHSFEYLTQTQLNSIKDEASADAHFPSARYDSFGKNVGYSGRLNDSEWYKKTFSGLMLRGVADSLGADTTKDITIGAGSRDGSSRSLQNSFTQKRYCFPSGAAAQGVEVDPMLALSSADQGETAELPKLLFGQTSAEGDINVQNWAKTVNQVSFGPAKTALTATVDGRSQKWTVAQVIGTASGLYTKEFRYTDGEDKLVYKVTGVPLSNLLSDRGIRAELVVINKPNSITSITSGGLDRFMVAVKGTVSVNGGAEKEITGDTELQLYRQGPTIGLSIDETFDSMEIFVEKPKAPTSVKAESAGYNSARLTWDKVPGADGYSIDQYDSSKKMWFVPKYTVENGKASSYTVKNLQTGTKYLYRVHAFKYASNTEFVGDYNKTVSATPTLSRPAITKAAKSGSKAVKITWKKTSGANGYLLYKSAKKTSGYKNIAALKKDSAVSYTDGKVAKGKTYYYKVRAYRTMGNSKAYSSYSGVKSLKR